MKALRLGAPRSLQLIDVPVPIPQAGEALVRVCSVGICGSDMSIYTGTHPAIEPPVIMGHEIFGIVESTAGDVTDVSIGQSVSVLACVGCGDCPRCDEGAANLCQSMRVIGGHRQGGLAEYVAVPATSLVALPEGPRDPLLALVEPAAVAHHATTTVPVEKLKGSSVVVYGLGAVGLLLAQILLVRGAERVYGVDPQQQARDVAARYGATVAAPEEIESVVAADGTEIDVIFECSGSRRALDQGISAVRNGGDIVLVGIQHEPMEVDWVRVQRHEKTIRGVQMYRSEDFEAVGQLVAQRKLTFRGIATDPVSLDEAPEIFSGLDNGTLQGKYLITVKGET